MQRITVLLQGRTESVGFSVSDSLATWNWREGLLVKRQAEQAETRPPLAAGFTIPRGEGFLLTPGPESLQSEQFCRRCGPWMPTGPPAFSEVDSHAISDYQ